MGLVMRLFATLKHVKNISAARFFCAELHFLLSFVITKIYQALILTKSLEKIHFIEITLLSSAKKQSSFTFLP
jgi:hypothetical protein